MSLSLVAAACGDDGGDEDTVAGGSSTSSSSTEPGDELPSCDTVDRTVVFGIFGTVTDGDGDGEVVRWLEDSAAEPAARPGAADVVHAYRDLGYDILYVTDEPATHTIGDQPLVEAVTVWLGDNRFPIGNDVTDVWAWDGEGDDASTALIEDLALMNTSGVDIDAGYASDPDVVFPLSTAGIPGGAFYTVGDAASDETTTSLPDADMSAHLPEVEGLDPVCE